MYICICSAVTEKEIHIAVGGGARTVEALQACLGVSGCCGACRETVHGCLAEAIKIARVRPEDAEDNDFSEFRLAMAS